jgi:ATP-dependent protease HslVU (ClpYQ) peptidase subunit
MRVSSLNFALLSIALSSTVSATTIAGIWTEKQVTIAADSKQTLIQDGQIIPSGSQTGCKVFEVRHLLVALAGLAQSEEISVVDAITNSKSYTTKTPTPSCPLNLW